MKTLILITSLLITVCLYTQNDNAILSEDFYLTYKLKYKLKDNEMKYIDTDKLYEDTDIKNRMQFTGDSIISVSYNFNGMQSFNLGNVESISFYEGRNILKGMLCGALSFGGLGFGIGLIGFVFGENKKGDMISVKELGLFMMTIGTLICASGGLIIGGIVGASTKSYEEYKLNRYKDNKAKKEAILRLAKKYKPRL